MCISTKNARIQTSEIYSKKCVGNVCKLIPNFQVTGAPKKNLMQVLCKLLIFFLWVSRNLALINETLDGASSHYTICVWVCMALMTAKVLCARSWHSIVKASAWRTYRFSYILRLLKTQESGIEHVAYKNVVSWWIGLAEFSQESVKDV